MLALHHLNMPCTLCGTLGHNRRTCRTWQIALPTLLGDPSPTNHDNHSDNTTPTIPEYMFDRTPEQNYNYVPSITSITIPASEIDNNLINTDSSVSRILFPDMPNTLSSDWFDSDDDILPDLEPIFPIEKPMIPSPLVECVKEPCHSTQCPICLENLQNIDLLVTRCGHQFHGTCMIQHLRLHDNCPYCRGTLFTTLTST